MIARRLSWTLWLVGILLSFKVATSVIYHLDVTIVNRYGNKVRIITTHPNVTHQGFVIPAGGSYQITSTSSTSRQMVITAYDATTFFPIKVDGKNSVFVFPSLTRVSGIHYVPSAPKDTSPTRTPVAGPTNATSTPNLTGPTVSSQGRTDAVTPDSLTGAAGSTEVSTDTVESTEGPTDAAGSTEGPTDAAVSRQVSTEGRAENATGGPTNAVVSTGYTTDTGVSKEYTTDTDVSTEGPTTDVSAQGATDTGKTPGPTDASAVSTVVSTKVEGRTDNATGSPANVAVSTDYAIDGPTTSISRGDPTSTVTTEGPTDAVKSDKDAEEGCENDKKYFFGIIVLAILLVVLLIIIACLVYQVRKNKDNMKSGILYVTPEKSNDCEGIKSEAVQDNTTYTTFKETTNGHNDKLMNESETGF